MTLFPRHGLSSAAMRRHRLFEMLRDGARKCWSQCGLSARFAAGCLAPGWSPTPLKQTRKVRAGLGVNRVVDGIR